MIVSQVYLLEGAVETEDFTYSAEGIEAKITVGVERADGLKCVRCWNYSEVVGTDSEHRELCGKCLDAVKA